MKITLSTPDKGDRSQFLSELGDDAVTYLNDLETRLVLCSAAHPLYTDIVCNREANHPGEHCRSSFGVETPAGHGYDNIWWPVNGLVEGS